MKVTIWRCILLLKKLWISHSHFSFRIYLTIFHHQIWENILYCYFFSKHRSRCKSSKWVGASTQLALVVSLEALLRSHALLLAGRTVRTAGSLCCTSQAADKRKTLTLKPLAVHEKRRVSWITRWWFHPLTNGIYRGYNLVGGFKYFSFSPLFGEMMQFD